jgi:hypothetical protein
MDVIVSQMKSVQILIHFDIIPPSSSSLSSSYWTVVAIPTTPVQLNGGYKFPGVAAPI